MLFSTGRPTACPTRVREPAFVTPGLALRQPTLVNADAINGVIDATILTRNPDPFTLEATNIAYIRSTDNRSRDREGAVPPPHARHQVPAAGPFIARSMSAGRTVRLSKYASASFRAARQWRA